MCRCATGRCCWGLASSEGCRRNIIIGAAGRMRFWDWAWNSASMLPIPNWRPGTRGQGRRVPNLIEPTASHCPCAPGAHGISGCLTPTTTT
jgi:hypothetical protein